MQADHAEMALLCNAHSMSEAFSTRLRDFVQDFRLNCFDRWSMHNLSTTPRVVTKGLNTEHIIRQAILFAMFPLKRLLNDDSNEASSQGFNEEQLTRNELYRGLPAQR